MKYVALFMLQLFVLGMVTNISPYNTPAENFISYGFLSMIVPLIVLLADNIYGKTE